MSHFDKRKDKFEKEYSHNPEVVCKAEANACRSFGLWLSETIGLGEEEANAYATDIVQGNMKERGFYDVIAFIWPTVQDKSLGYAQHQLHEKLNQLFNIAKVQIVTESEAEF